MAARVAELEFAVEPVRIDEHLGDLHVTGIKVLLSEEDLELTTEPLLVRRFEGPEEDDLPLQDRLPLGRERPTRIDSQRDQLPTCAGRRRSSCRVKVSLSRTQPLQAVLRDAAPHTARRTRCALAPSR